MNFANHGGGLIPITENARAVLEQSAEGEVITFKEVTQRDVSFHRCYMALLTFIWGYMPDKFRLQVPKKDFYKWLKHFKGEYEIKFTFKDGSKMIEYNSIAFGRMSQKKFEEHIRLQLPFIYSNLIGAYYEGDHYDSVIETIEMEFEKFLVRL